MSFIEIDKNCRQTCEVILRQFVESSPAALAMFDKNMRYIFVSQRWLEDYKLLDRPDIIGKFHYEIFPQITEDWKEIYQRCLAGASEKGNRPSFLDDRQLKWEIKPWYRENREIGGIIMFSEPIMASENSTANHSRKDLSWLADRDHLTGLMNRRCLEEKLTTILSRMKHQIQSHIFCYLDLDQFKIVNDVCGHLAGDELLRQVSLKIKKQIRNSDILARLGGDEFGLLLHHCSLEDGIAKAEQIRQVIENFHFVWNENSFSIGVSIGLVSLDEIGDLNCLLGAADAACYAAKDKGRNCLHIYDCQDPLLQKQRSQRHWLLRLHQALERDSFCLYAQKIIPLSEKNQNSHYYEILLRLQDPTGQIIPPMAFIPAAERYGLMPAIDRWVIATFFSRYDDYFKSRFFSAQNRYTINISASSVNNESFEDFVSQQIQTYSFPAEQICFEITETTAITNLTRAVNLIKSLKKLGVGFAIDDFGTGMSSLAYLKNLPVDYLKIDGSFIKNIINDPIDSVMVDSFNRISQKIGIKTIAEFVENEEILAKITEFGLDYAQGYGIEKPSPLCFI